MLRFLVRSLGDTSIEKKKSKNNYGYRKTKKNTLKGNALPEYKQTGLDSKKIPPLRRALTIKFSHNAQMPGSQASTHRIAAQPDFVAQAQGPF